MQVPHLFEGLSGCTANTDLAAVWLKTELHIDSLIYTSDETPHESLELYLKCSFSPAKSDESHSKRVIIRRGILMAKVCITVLLQPYWVIPMPSWSGETS